MPFTFHTGCFLSILDNIHWMKNVLVIHRQLEWLLETRNDINNIYRRNETYWLAE